MRVTGEVLVGRSRDTDSVTQLCFVRQSNGDDGTKTVELGDKSEQEETDQEGYGGRTDEKEKMTRCKRRQEKAAGGDWKRDEGEEKMN